MEIKIADHVSKFVFVLFVIGAFIIGIFIPSSSPELDIANSFFDKRIKKVFAKELEEIKKEISLNSDFRINEMIGKIYKNAKKISKEQKLIDQKIKFESDIKKSDIDVSLSFEKLIPKESINTALQASFNLLAEWQTNNP